MPLAPISDLLYPAPPEAVSGAPTVSATYTLDNFGETFALICQAPIAGTIRKIHWLISSLTTAGDVESRVETVSSGSPSGTLVSASATKSQSVAAAGWTTWDFGAGNGAAVTRGQMIAVMLKNDPATGGNMALARFTDDAVNGGLPFLHASAIPGVVAGTPCLALEYATGEIPPIPRVTPLSSVATLAWDSATNPVTRGLKFRLPFPARIVGFWAWSNQATGVEFVAELFDSDGAPFAAAVAVTMPENTPPSSVGDGIRFWRFTTAQALAKNTDYRLAITPQSGMNDFTLYAFDVDAAAYLEAYPGGANWIYTTTNVDPPTGLGDWSDTATRRPFMGLVLDHLDDGDTGVPGTVALAPRRKSVVYGPTLRRRYMTFGITPPPPAVPIPIMARRRYYQQRHTVRRVQPTAFSQTTINQTNIISYSRKVR